MKRTIRIGSKCYDADIPRVMTILNATPDSFYKGSRFSEQALVDAAGKALDEGAFVLDIGGFSTRPGGIVISVEEELDRTIPAIESVSSCFPDALISVDTFRSDVAHRAVEAGAHMVNDVSGGRFDAHMHTVVARLSVPYVLMHLRGDLHIIHNPQSYNDLPSEVLADLQIQVHHAQKEGISDIIVDPGFGFSKRDFQNFELLRGLEILNLLDCPILVGVSRKRMVWQTLGITADEALNGTTALHMLALQQGARWLRVHDTQPALEAIQIFNAYRSE